VAKFPGPALIIDDLRLYTLSTNLLACMRPHRWHRDALTQEVRGDLDWFLRKACMTSEEDQRAGLPTAVRQLLDAADLADELAGMYAVQAFQLRLIAASLAELYVEIPPQGGLPSRWAQVTATRQFIATTFAASLDGGSEQRALKEVFWALQSWLGDTAAYKQFAATALLRDLLAGSIQASPRRSTRHASPCIGGCAAPVRPPTAGVLPDTAFSLTPPPRDRSQRGYLRHVSDDMREAKREAARLAASVGRGVGLAAKISELVAAPGAPRELRAMAAEVRGELGLPSPLAVGGMLRTASLAARASALRSLAYSGAANAAADVRLAVEELHTVEPTLAALCEGDSAQGCDVAMEYVGESLSHARGATAAQLAALRAPLLPHLARWLGQGNARTKAAACEVLAAMCSTAEGAAQVVAAVPAATALALAAFRELAGAVGADGRAASAAPGAGPAKFKLLCAVRALRNLTAEAAARQDAVLGDRAALDVLLHLRHQAAGPWADPSRQDAGLVADLQEDADELFGHLVVREQAQSALAAAGWEVRVELRRAAPPGAAGAAPAGGGGGGRGGGGAGDTPGAGPSQPRNKRGRYGAAGGR
jgi:hypothetical protein